MNNYDKVRELIAKKLYFDFVRYPTGSVAGVCWRDISLEKKKKWLDEADDILSDPLVAVLAENQKAPQVEMNIHLWRDYSPDMAYEKCFEDMLIAGFCKVEPKPEKEEK